MNLNDMIFATDEKPLDIMPENGGYTAIFR